MAWLTAGAVVTGTALWAMHFIGMLALAVPLADTDEILRGAVAVVLSMSVIATLALLYRAPL